VGAAVGVRSLQVGTAVGLWRLVVGAKVGAAVGARHAGEDLGAITARESSTAKGNARFFEVLAGPGDAALCGVEEWTIVEVRDAILEGE